MVALTVPLLVKTASAAATIGLFSVPAMTALRARKLKTCGDLAPLQFSAILLNATMWGLYGAAVRNLVPLSLSNVVGVTSCLFCAATFRRYGTPQQRRDATRQTAVVLVLTALVAARFAEVLGEGASQAAPTSELRALGVFAVASSFALYSAPLSEMAGVIRKGASDALSPAVSAASWVNAVLFAAYGAVEGDTTVFVPGACGAVMSTAQLALIAMYPQTPRTAPSAAAADAAATGLARKGVGAGVPRAPSDSKLKGLSASA